MQSKLPNVGITIFTEMSQLANRYQAVNLSQGFPDFDAPQDLIRLVNQYMLNGFNQYAPLGGVMALRERISQKLLEVQNAVYHPESEITITAGGTQAIFTAIASILNLGDEAVIFEPAYDCYQPTIELFGGFTKPIVLEGPDFKIDWNRVRSAITEKTKLIILNNPNNPSTKCLKAEDFEELKKIVRDKEIFILSDEVYEHIVFDHEKHISVASYPELREKSFVVASFGKLFHITGWKTGYCLAPAALMAEFRKVHQFNVFCVNTPVQMALADFLERKDEYLSLGVFFQEKRNYFMNGLNSTKFRVICPEGSYFLLADYSGISQQPDKEFCIEMTQRNKVAGIPVSAFYTKNPDGQFLIRFCFAKKNETLEKALEFLVKL